ncbi:MAG: hypothetical protein AMXMBFR61_15690 [Fimbriimonadales bacterium]
MHSLDPQHGAAKGMLYDLTPFLSLTTCKGWVTSDVMLSLSKHETADRTSPPRRLHALVGA